ncbi:MAG: lactate utilization protein [Lachnospiraceae bacterium]|nr:lactate utilization protein [Lachnospiraceae bacterium]
MEFEKIRNRKLGPQVVKALNNRNIEACFVETKEDALKKALEIMPEGSVVSCGGVMSAHEIGLIEALKNGNYTFLDRDGAKTPEEKKEIEKRVYTDCDYFIMSANGMSENGVIVNIDGNANRVSALAFGPEHVLMIVGMNKVVHSEEDAYRRAKYVAAPINTQRFGLNTPCCEFGKCVDCQLEDCICCQILITRYSRHKGRIKVILVNEDLGF